MKVIDHNPDRTVGVVEGVENLIHIGGFSFELMQEWMQAIEAAFTMDHATTIHLFVRESKAQNSHQLFASAEGKDPMVALAGKAPEDDEPWGDVRG